MTETTSITASPIDVRRGVKLRGRCAQRDGAWLVSLFLVNEQAAPKTNKDEAWLFQPTLSVESTDESAIFVGWPSTSAH